MANEYKIRLEVRGRTSEFGADSVAELFYIFSTELFRLDVLTSQVNIQNKSNEKQDENTAAQRLIDQYYVKFNKMDNRSDTSIFRAGKEIELAKCYLARMTVKKTVGWLKKEEDFKTSESAVGRYWKNFAQLPAAIKIA
jgi:hypothetical protein